ncbi:class III lanthipeptide [Bacillus pacificus]|nr:class III lanthipeptide [Bacillus pacificus]MBL3796923.1 class III lanthipeptide [Bacillus cereus]MBL3858806.1 class III lanthipeptide [Bacillus cereus]MCU5375088.1 class III lanthipeptide [Bacillus pacificus]HDR7969886.1 class III lanthipeptide [Bacillus pacificus]
MTKLLALQKIETNALKGKLLKSTLSIICDKGTGSSVSLYVCNSTGDFQ